MTPAQILEKAKAFGKAHDQAAFAAFAALHRCVSRGRNSPKNLGKVESIDLLAAYAAGARERLAIRQQSPPAV